MLNWLRSLAALMSGKTGKLARIDAATRMTIDEDFRDSGDLIEPRAPLSSVDALDELERLLGSLLAACDLGMNLAPACIEHAQGDGVRRPVKVDRKRNRASGAMGVGDQFANYGRRRVEKLDSILHPLSALLSLTRTGR